ncbi:DUF3304 domain-containing protein [Klebsiella aerogenes]|uniref:DUF3304 domain-containing protein n=2 Tax=Klebsiella aerogenes TaxID=548 RepID=UPI0011816AF6|nr:DUF3304 domain-containing protein [Klebsiella aerogenes]ELA1690670.1 DUF3304 domain-containing protein [Klebsiella aerogenes]ELW9545177.1 DUF3304 domain-containing protein [Klebsiella aerogenes]QDR55792.1 DUF3304 domain-containing protein [Klebsiella aerogenes]TSI59111.1 DUF3304 domain-containing protein [Klebsiella aerogenes]TSI78112.1 DUF3304 domain-containing protein [Klebsiella aerogenes]
MIKHIRILPGGLAVLSAVLLCLLTACRDHSRDGMSAADITVLNHGPDAIVSMQVNGYGGPRANPYGGGGGFCCVMVPDVWRPGLTAKITWTSDPNSWMKSSEMPDDYETHYQKHGPITVPIERWEKGQACGFHVHIFPCDKVRIVRSCVLPGGPVQPGQPEYPVPQSPPDWRERAHKILIKHIREEVVCPTPQTPR